MQNELDIQFVRKVDGLMRDGATIGEVAKELKMRPTTLYQRVRGLGYKIEKYGRLVPVNAPEINDTQVGAA